MPKMIDLRAFRESNLLIESEPINELTGVYRWTVTGEKYNDVEDIGNSLMRAANSATFTAPKQILDKRDARYKWYRVIGYTSENPNVDCTLMIKKEKLP